MPSPINRSLCKVLLSLALITLAAAAPDHRVVFTDITDVSKQAGVADKEGLFGLGVAWCDLDNDGDVDVVINNLDGAPTILRNDVGTVWT